MTQGLPEPDRAVPTLAKLEGHAPELRLPADAFAALEIAYDESTALQLWVLSRADDLPAADGDPDEPGRYGSLADVDFDSHVVALWSSGQSGTCPSWLASVEGDPDGVTLREADLVSGGCTEDYVPYRSVVAVPRDRLPEVGSADATGDARLLAYPAQHDDLRVVLRPWTPPAA
ncbi:hypothetical protein [Cellulomonas endophytica]|uniref:hypothetical protein n=1 Tax=Cellulomonas endophytica TaxID=2494735 RepID=UPI0010132CD4|nr:hypothetical protein [Cellulomonas endophytica]